MLWITNKLLISNSVILYFKKSNLMSC